MIKAVGYKPTTTGKFNGFIGEYNQKFLTLIFFEEKFIPSSPDGGKAVCYRRHVDQSTCFLDRVQDEQEKSSGNYGPPV